MNRFVASASAGDYDVVSAFDGREGLEKALRFRPMLVVSDIMMPNVSGVEMIAEMRERAGAAAHADPAALGESRRGADGEAARRRRPGLTSSSRSPSGSSCVRVRNLVLAEQARAQMDDAAEGRRERQPRQGRVPGDARPRAAQSAVADPDRAAADEAARRRRGPSASATVIERQVSHLTRLVDDLLDVSRIARGQGRAQDRNRRDRRRRARRPSRWRARCSSSDRHTLNVDVRQRIARRRRPDPARQVISNLLTNAAKYTPPDGDHLRVQATRG